MTKRAKQFVKDHESQFHYAYTDPTDTFFGTFDQWCADVWRDYEQGKPTLFGRKPGSLPKPRGF